CFLNFTYSASLDDGSPLPSFITFNDATNSFSIYTADNSSAQVYPIKVVYSYLSDEFTIPFDLNVTEYDFCEIMTISKPTISSVQHTINSTTTTFNHAAFESIPVYCIESHYTEPFLSIYGSSLPFSVTYDNSN